MGQTDRQTDRRTAAFLNASVVGDVHTGHAEVVGVREVLLDKARPLFTDFSHLMSAVGRRDLATHTDHTNTNTRGHKTHTDMPSSHTHGPHTSAIGRLLHLLTC